MSTNRYREQIDACRPGTGDLSLPALAELFRAVETDKALADELARSDRFDRAVSTAMHDVPLPAGLLERLESRLAAADVKDVESTGEVALPPAPARSSRRKILVAALSLAALVLIALGAMFWPRPGRHITNHELASLSAEWFHQQVPPSAWQSLKSAPAAYDPPREVAAKTAAWRPFSSSDGHRGVVFDLTSRTGRRANLFVIASPHQYDVQNLPYTKLDPSGGIAVAAWQRGGRLYVVVIDKDGQGLDDFIRTPSIARLALP
jgi:hypothetical protein